jgi:hypothetical protein
MPLLDRFAALALVAVAACTDVTPLAETSATLSLWSAGDEWRQPATRPGGRIASLQDTGCLTLDDDVDVTANGRRVDTWDRGWLQHDHCVDPWFEWELLGPELGDPIVVVEIADDSAIWNVELASPFVATAVERASHFDGTAAVGDVIEFAWSPNDATVDRAYVDVSGGGTDVVTFSLDPIRDGVVGGAIPSSLSPGPLRFDVTVVVAPTIDRCDGPVACSARRGGTAPFNVTIR